MIDLHLARRLKAAGLVWHPRPGDRFGIPQPDLLGQVFTLSEMTIEAHPQPSGTVLRFNGTTEWALDSVPAEEAVWLPAEHQLRDLLGAAFRGLQVLDGASASGPGVVSAGAGGDEASGSGCFRVVTTIPGLGERAFRAPVAEDAYALALLALIRRAAD